MSPDELTGLFKRSELFPKLQASLALASQHNQSLALGYFDLDHLMTVNDDYGHVAGDGYIASVGDALKANFDGECYAARIGGDEFLGVMPGLTLEQAKARVEGVRMLVEFKPLEFIKDGQLASVPVSVSGGLAFLPAGEAAVNVDDLIRRAYEAVIRAKENGGNSIKIYAEVEERDPLTGVNTRAGMLARLDQNCTAAERARSTVAVISLDIDEFDSINRQYGRYSGDEVLRRVAAILNSNLKEIGIVGRFGGDQFIVILPNSRSETAFILAEEVRKVIEDTPVPIQVGEMKSHLPVRISGGVAEFPSDGSDWRELLRKADEALYRAKSQGRNRICLPVSSQMVTKTSHFTQTQLEKLADLGKRSGKSEAYLLREALDDLLRKYDR
jgi:diguanylate cyclase (GGDEF)-like protein